MGYLGIPIYSKFDDVWWGNNENTLGSGIFFHTFSSNTRMGLSYWFRDTNGYTPISMCVLSIGNSIDKPADVGPFASFFRHGNSQPPRLKTASTAAFGRVLPTFLARFKGVGSWGLSRNATDGLLEKGEKTSENPVKFVVIWCFSIYFLWAFGGNALERVVVDSPGAYTLLL